MLLGGLRREPIPQQKLRVVLGVQIGRFDFTDWNVAATNFDGDILIWETDKKRLIKTLFGHAGNALTVRLSHSGDYAISMSPKSFSVGGLGGQKSLPDGTIRIWNIKSGKEVSRLVRTAKAETSAMIVSEEPLAIIYETRGNPNVEIYDCRNGKNMKIGDESYWLRKDSPRIFGYTEDGRLVLVKTNEQLAWVDASSGRVESTFNFPGKGKPAVASQDGTHLLMTESQWGSRNVIARLYKLTPNPVLMHSIEVPWPESRTLVTFSPTGSVLAIATVESGTKLYDFSTGDLVGLLPHCNALIFTSDHNLMTLDRQSSTWTFWIKTRGYGLRGYLSRGEVWILPISLIALFVSFRRDRKTFKRLREEAEAKVAQEHAA